MKRELRTSILEQRDCLSDIELQVKSSKIIDQLLTMQEYQVAEEIYTFVSFGSEVDTRSLILRSLLLNKKVFAPKIIEKGIIEFYQIMSYEDLAPSKWGILEPTTCLLGELNDQKNNKLIIIPGVAFDKEGNRMGYGGGFYDRYLTKNNDCQVKRFAICYDLQIIDKVPVEEYDQKVDKIITESREITIS